ncbi:WD repeat containing protein [Lasiodiplodia theobromae]|uniref:U3 small nucleolar RNA-associated protein 17 n=2 Tax=Lasiodiplodia theobromae TaxID=45133 RepID=A0A5N5DR92_9PEZI|nr:WD repeat containing protein [Lasiodiplodia theobromae]KAB2580283.1 U3 small nucleolar RNA-associated protein 17 [Lasiodiplodia theobromae]KAF4546721.1 WD repeat containing protein [Lasiodiplodia theobromae]
MAAPTSVQDAPTTPQDARRKRKAKDSSSSKHDAKRIRTQDEKNAAASGTKQIKTETALAIVGDKNTQTVNQDAGDVVKTKLRPDRSSWYTSEPAGGRFLPIDPVFSKDERYIIFSTAKAVHIYSTATSLLVRTLPMGTSHSITAYALSDAEPNQLYVSDASGYVILWDWVSGKKIQRYNLSATIRGIATSAVETDSGDKLDTVFTLDKGERNIIYAQRLRGHKDESEKVAEPLLRTKVPLQSFIVAGGGQVIAAAAKDRVFVGHLKNTSATTPKDFVFIWRELSCTQTITSIDIRVSRQESAKATPKKGASPIGQVNLVIGCSSGALLVYEDIISKLSSAEKQQKKDPKDAPSPLSLAPRHLHWHRNPVGAVKWSLDGNYIISGGQETVLVLWQLQTSKKQFLPNLTSTIDGVVVSPSGTSYAVQLADNSVIVLSTTELVPKANIAGVQSRFFTLEATVDKVILDEVRRTAAAINPQNPNQILLSVPASQPRTEAGTTSPPAPFLQSYDISSNHHVFRQAITRNNATNINQGPNATKLREPDLRHLQLSHDGKWLATVEEWAPPVEDIEHLAVEKKMIEEEQNARREVYLKFWLWNEEKSQWMLETRIDAPHKFTDKVISGRIFDLKYDPSSTSFATVGEDGFVRVWAPKTRLHDGTVVRGNKGEGLVTWSNRNAIRLEAAVEGLDANSDIPSELVPVHARLAYSPDGSVLAASQEFYGNNSQGLVHFIDPSTGAIRYSRGGLYTTGLVDLGFVGRQFIIVSNSLSVWDLVDDELNYGYSFRPLGLTRAQKAEIAHLAINNTDGTFAVSLPLPEQQKKNKAIKSEAETDAAAKQQQPQPPKKRQSKVFVFSTSSPRPLYSIVVPQIVTALLPAGNNNKGFVVLNSSAEIRVVAPKTAAGLQLVGPVAAPEENLDQFVDQETALEPLVDDDDEEEVETKEEMEKLPEVPDEMVNDGDENDKPVVRPEMLAGVFDVGPSFALPPVRDLFEAVVGLYGRKPRGGVVAA